MENIKNILKFLKDNLREAYIFTTRKYSAFISPKRKMKILFSLKDEWEPGIRKDFRYTQHELTFAGFSAENIVKNDLIIPLTIPDLKYLTTVRHLIINNPIPIPAIESLSLCEDKYLFNQILIKNNFGKFIPRMGDNLPYPYILKKKIDEWGQNSHIILDRQQEQKILDTVPTNDYFRQEIVPGKYEYATHILFSKGKIVHSVNIKYIFETDTFIKGKDKTSFIKKTGQCPYLKLFSSILNLIGFEGLCCFNFKVIDGHPLIFEINPRFGGSLCTYFFSFMKHLN